MTPTINEHQALHVINALQRIGPVTARRLLRHFGEDPLAILNAPSEELRKVKGVGETIIERLNKWYKHFDLDNEERLLVKYEGAFITCKEAEYPDLLNEIVDPPVGLNFLGRYRCADPCVAIVGTRRATHYGRGIARQLGEELARKGYCVVSGLARGIDTAAHEGALKVEEGRTVAVLGSGPDIVYPPENVELYRKIISQGAVISEFPFGRRADRQTFPMRNRVISGLSLATVIVESANRGGAIITARFAAEQGRLVFAVPGRIDQSSSAGCHQLIRDGAQLLSSIDDLLEELEHRRQMEFGFAAPRYEEEDDDDTAEPEEGRSRTPTLPDDLDANQRKVAECFADGAILSPDEVTGRTSLPPHEVSSALMLLELRRVLAKRPDGSFEKRY